MRYYIADCHFFHEALNREMDHRGFASVEEMNEYMIKRWNEKVRNRDEVVILGDLSMGNAEQTNALLDRLQGKLFLIVGNHDNRYLRSKTFHKERFGWIYPYAELHDGGRKVVLSHYPIACYNGQYLKNKKGEPRTYMLYGHVHDSHDERLIEQYQQMVEKTRIPDRDGGTQSLSSHMINCFCMYSDYQPLSLDEWIALTKQRLIRCQNVEDSL